MSYLRRVVCLTVASTAMFPGAALAATWSPASTIYTAPGENQNSGVLTGIDGAGTETAVWTADKYYTATKPAGGSWSTPVALPISGPKADLALAVGKSGHAIVSWTTTGYGGAGGVYAITRTPAGTWSSSESVLSDEPLEGAQSTSYTKSFVAAPDGTLVGASVRQTVTIPVSPQYPLTTVTALRPSVKAAGGSWATGLILEPSPKWVRAAVDGQGNATLIYDSFGGLKVVTKTAGGTWGAPVVLIPSGQPGNVPGDNGQVGTIGTTTPSATLSVNDAGQMVVGLGANAIRRAADGTWGALENVAAGGFVGPEWADAKIDDSGRSTAVWTENTSEDHTSKVLTSTAAAGGAWTAPTPLSPTLSTTSGTEYSSLHLAVAGSGKAVVSFKKATEGEPDSATVTGAVRQSGTAFEPAAPLSPKLGGFTALYAHSSPQITAAGAATVVWPEGKLLRESHVDAPPVATPTPAPTATPAPTTTPAPTATPAPTTTPAPTATPAPASAPSISSVGGFAYGWLGGIAIINGKNFTDVSSVTFGAKKATTGFAIGTGLLVVVAPPQEAGSYTVRVETKGGVATSPTPFTYKRLF